VQQTARRSHEYVHRLHLQRLHLHCAGAFHADARRELRRLAVERERERREEALPGIGYRLRHRPRERSTTARDAEPTLASR
jgi:hypothetical protein